MAKQTERRESEKALEHVLETSEDVGEQQDGAEQVQYMPRGFYIRMKMRAQSKGKRIVAQHIAEKYVKDFDAVLLDAGSTAESVAEEIFARRQFLSVLTINMGAYAAYTRARDIAQHALESPQGLDRINAGGGLSGNELLITGGRYADTYESLLGEGAVATIQPFTPNITIIGISGLRSHEGVFCHGAEEYAIKNLLWTKPTDIRLIAADWSKIGKRDAHKFGMPEDLAVNARKGVLVTCNPPGNVSPEELEAFEEQLSEIKKAGITVDRLDIPEDR